MTKFVIIKHTETVQPATIFVFDNAEERRNKFTQILFTEFANEASTFINSLIGKDIKPELFGYYVDDANALVNAIGPAKKLEASHIQLIKPHLEQKAMTDSVKAALEIAEHNYWFNDATNDVYTYATI